MVRYIDGSCCRDRELLRYASADSGTETSGTVTDCDSEASCEDSVQALTPCEECSLSQQAFTDPTSKQLAELLADSVAAESDCSVTLDEILSAVTLDDSTVDGAHFEPLSVEKASQAELADRDKAAPSGCIHPALETLKEQNCEHLNSSEESICGNSKVVSSEDDNGSSDESWVDEQTAAEREQMRRMGLPVALGSSQKSLVCIYLSGSVCQSGISIGSPGMFMYIWVYLLVWDFHRNQRCVCDHLGPPVGLGSPQEKVCLCTAEYTG